MKFLLLILSILWLQEIPFKPKEEFDIKLDYQLKQRPSDDPNSINLGSPTYRKSGASSVLPYLTLNISVLKLPEEKMRIHVSKNIEDRPINRKVDVQTIIQLDLGFTDDMKDRITAYEYTISFVSAEKVPINKIVISVDKDGSFFVNGEKRGKL